MACDDPNDPFYLVEFKSDPYMLEEETLVYGDVFAPEGTVVVRNDLSQNQFAGACPPEGRTHNYVFTVYAMPVPAVPLDETASSAMVGGMTNMMSLDRASITATYER